MCVVAFVNSGGRIRGKNFAFSSPFICARVCISGKGRERRLQNHMSEKKRRDVETEGQNICRTICNLATGSRTRFYTPSYLSSFARPRPAIAILTERGRNRREGEQDAASRYCFRTKKKKTRKTQETQSGTLEL